MKKFPIPGLVNCLCASLKMGQIKVDSSEKKLMQAKEKHCKAAGTLAWM